MENSAWNGAAQEFAEPQAATGYDGLSEFRFGSADVLRGGRSTGDSGLQPVPAPIDDCSVVKEVDRTGGSDKAPAANDPVSNYYERYQQLGPAPGSERDDKPNPDTPRPQPNPNPDVPQPGPRPQPNPYRPQPNPYQPQPNPYRPQPNPYRPQPDPFNPNPNPYPRPRPRPRPPCPVPGT